MERLLEMLFIPVHRVLTTSCTLQCKEWVVWKVAGRVCSGLTVRCSTILFYLVWILFWSSSCTGSSVMYNFVMQIENHWKNQCMKKNCCGAIYLSWECRLILCLIFKKHKHPFILSLDTDKYNIILRHSTMAPNMKTCPKTLRNREKLVREAGRQDFKVSSICIF